MLALLALAFLVVPIVELYVIIQVGQGIGVGWTIILLLAMSAFGAWLVRREGRRAWRALQEAIGSGRMPNRELADGALILVGGTLLLTPGFLTDVAGLFLIVPFTRPVARRGLAWLVSRRLLGAARVRVVRPPGGPTPPPGPGPYRNHDDRVVRGEVVDDDSDDGGTAPRP
jgi:UPF0716 protein FxsA